MSITRRAASRSQSPCGDTRPCTLFGLASDGVYQADRVTPVAGALLPHRFTLTTHRILADAVVRRSVLCCTFPSLTAGRRYRPSCPAKPGLSSHDRRSTCKHPVSDHPTHFRPQCKASSLRPPPTTHPSTMNATREQPNLCQPAIVDPTFAVSGFQVFGILLRNVLRSPN